MNAASYDQNGDKAMVKRNVLISGATSFVGRALVNWLALAGHHVSALYRQQHPQAHESVSWIGTGDLATTPINPAISEGIDVFINLAAPRHATSKDTGGLASEAASIARNVSDFVTAANIRRVVVLS